jgi:hypothetical protein
MSVIETFVTPALASLKAILAPFVVTALEKLRTHSIEYVLFANNEAAGMISTSSSARATVD